jgi:hypothetical protein
MNLLCRLWLEGFQSPHYFCYILVRFTAHCIVNQRAYLKTHSKYLESAPERNLIPSVVLQREPSQWIFDRWFGSIAGVHWRFLDISWSTPSHDVCCGSRPDFFVSGVLGSPPPCAHMPYNLARASCANVAPWLRKLADTDGRIFQRSCAVGW